MNPVPTPFKAGCERPAGTTLAPAAGETRTKELEIKEAKASMIKVGAPAPDFELPGYLKGQFSNYKLSEYKGKWVFVCFYPGDFTFV